MPTRSTRPIGAGTRSAQQPAARPQVCARSGSPGLRGSAPEDRFRRSLLTAICEQSVGLPPSHDALASTYARSWEGLGSRPRPARAPRPLRARRHRLQQVLRRCSAAQPSELAAISNRSRSRGPASRRRLQRGRRSSVVVRSGPRSPLAAAAATTPAAQPRTFACRAAPSYLPRSRPLPVSVAATNASYRAGAARGAFARARGSAHARHRALDPPGGTPFPPCRPSSGQAERSIRLRRCLYRLNRRRGPFGRLAAGASRQNHQRKAPSKVAVQTSPTKGARRY